MDKKAVVTLSKKKYHDFVQALEAKYEDTDLVADILKTLCDTIRFDPSLSSYDETQHQRIKARRERLKQQGITTYISSGNKSWYDTHRRVVAKPFEGIFVE